MMLCRRVLHELLGDSLCSTQHACRANRVVGRDQNEMLHVGLDCCIDHVARSCNVVCDCFQNVVFHQRNVLVRCCMEHCVRAMLLEDMEDSIAVADVGDHRHDVDIREAQRQLLKDVEDR